MSPFARGFALGLGGALGVAAFVGAALIREPETRLVVAAVDIPEDTDITMGMLEARTVPTRFLSKRKLGAASVAGVMGQPAPQAMRAGDFIDPNHFGTSTDACLVEARGVATALGLPDAATRDFLERLKRTVR